MKKLILLLLLALPLNVSAKMLYEYGSFDKRAVMAVQCGIIENVFDYYGDKETNLELLGCLEGNFGTSITTINATDFIKTSRTTINDNFTALNNGKIEISTTTLPLITSLPGLTTAGALATVGTIGTGVWQGTDVGVAYGGTGTSTLTANSVLLGNGTNAIQSLPAGSNDQVLTLVAGVPAWTSSTLDESLNYDWTGDHTFTTGSTTFNGVNRFNGYTELDDVLIASSTVPYSTASTSAASVGYVNYNIYSEAVAATTTSLLWAQEHSTVGVDGTSYIKVKEYIMMSGGTATFVFNVTTTTGADTSAGKIYVNGVAVGAEFIGGSGGAYLITKQNISFNRKDLVQLYIKEVNGGAGSAQNTIFDIYAYRLGTPAVSMP